MSEEGSRGLICQLKKTFEEIAFQQQTSAGVYKAILGPTPVLLGGQEVDIEEERDWQEDSSEEDEDDDDALI